MTLRIQSQRPPMHSGYVTKPYAGRLDTKVTVFGQSGQRQITTQWVYKGIAPRFGLENFLATEKNGGALKDASAVVNAINRSHTPEADLFSFVLRSAVYSAAKRAYTADSGSKEIIVGLRDIIEGVIAFAYHSVPALEEKEGAASLMGEKGLVGKEFSVPSDFGAEVPIKVHQLRAALDALFPEGESREYRYRELEAHLSALRQQWAKGEINDADELSSPKSTVENPVDPDLLKRFIADSVPSGTTGNTPQDKAAALVQEKDWASQKILKFDETTLRFFTAFLFKYQNRPTQISLAGFVNYLYVLDSKLKYAYESGGHSGADGVKDVAGEIRTIRAAVTKEASQADSKLFKEMNTRSIEWFRLRLKQLHNIELPESDRLMTVTQHRMARALLAQLEGAQNRHTETLESRLDVLLNQLPWEPTEMKEPTREEMLVAFQAKFANMDTPAELIVDAILAERHARKFMATGQLDPKDYKPLVFVFDGAPGVGKTEFGKTIGEFTGRPFQEVYLGGESDPKSLTGHDSVYVGAKPGSILQAFIDAATDQKGTNPVILLDEVDKMGISAHGNPESVLLRILDKENNKRFKDTFLGIPYDISKALFILTSNDFRKLSDPLKSRLTPIIIRGIPPQEKIKVIREKSLPKIRREMGLTQKQLESSKEIFDFSDETLDWLRENYAPGLGMRDIEDILRTLATIVAAKLEAHQWQKRQPLPNDIPQFTPQNIPEYLNRAPATPLVKLKSTPQVGHIQVMVAGGARGRSGGCSDFGIKLQLRKVDPQRADQAGLFIGNVPVLHGKMCEDAERNTIIYFQHNAAKFGLTELLTNYHVNVNFHEGRIMGPTDGPSAGLAKIITTYSALTLKPIPGDLAVTGAFNASTGEVTRIGGLREKIAFSIERGAKTILYPKENQADFDRMEASIRTAPGVKFYAVSTFDEARPLVWPEDTELVKCDTQALANHYLSEPN